VLYRVVNDRYLKRRPMLFTTNKPLAALGQVLHDGDLAEAILDRVLERGTHFVLRGRSYRTRHHKREEEPIEAGAA
jgi:DNA replication protein DnaC